MKLVHHPAYDLNFGPHVFPSQKFQMIRDRLLGEGTFSSQDVLRPAPASDDEMELVHDADWLKALRNGTMSMQQILRLEVPYSQQMVRAFQLMAGGTILAARIALEEGAAMNLGGGFHHAFAGHGEGFCAIHDVAVAIRVLHREGKIRRALVIDCDVHQGNGTAAIFAEDLSVFTISLHQFDNYPYEKPPSSIDVHLPDGMEDGGYMALLEANYETALDEFQPDLVMYVAGADPYFDDQLGGLALTLSGLRERDRIVTEGAKSRRIPIVATTAGGYARRLEDTITIHAATAAILK
jgi:acetoin utilization deacetylase AcuC-like enzyme